ncbi:50S ribosomal protein L6 [Candidatus Micrarchaeota archaeon RBG_16_49_10]|nr:50S ribosomal protein L6, large subunit ribosomal protein L6 [uncultured archaeon]OGI15390.1 MAG: 50S ribosomal protein L6 [Candidatus Micrarchaeota archaeon RBG_16_49_10]
MEKQLTVLEGVEVEISGKKVRVKGKQGTLERTFTYFYDIKIVEEGGTVKVSTTSEERRAKAMVGTIIAHIRNMAIGVSQGYTRRMRVIYSHFPMSVKVEGDKIFITNFIGEKTPRVSKIIGGTKVDVQGQEITVRGLNKEEVGQTCLNMEHTCRITKFDRRIFQDGIYPVKD